MPGCIHSHPGPHADIPALGEKGTWWTNGEKTEVEKSEGCNDSKEHTRRGGQKTELSSEVEVFSGKKLKQLKRSHSQNAHNRDTVRKEKNLNLEVKVYCFGKNYQS